MAMEAGMAAMVEVAGTSLYQDRCSGLQRARFKCLSNSAQWGCAFCTFPMCCMLSQAALQDARLQQLSAYAQLELHSPAQSASSMPSCTQLTPAGVCFIHAPISHLRFSQRGQPVPTTVTAASDMSL